ncbi:hypothetical protein DL96DRAFT_1803496 [Flagelloscypha sp. PMI_526]|nr:hypothetical protein DL96DRAFT_1803496 [Flagelloscypha sp. PMI_526]
MDTSKSPISALSNDVVLYLGHFMEPSDLLSFRSTSKRFLQCLSDDGYWQSLVEDMQTNQVPQAAFNLPDMKRADLERFACLPGTMNRLLNSAQNQTSELPIYPTREIHSRLISMYRDPLSTPLLDVHLVPGGQFLVARAPTGFVVWKLPIDQSKDDDIIIAKTQELTQPCRILTSTVMVLPDQNILQLNALVRLSAKDLPLVLEPYWAFSPPKCVHSLDYNTASRFFSWEIKHPDESETDYLYFICDLLQLRHYKIALKGVQFIDKASHCGQWLVVRYGKSFGNDTHGRLSIFDMVALENAGLAEGDQYAPVFDFALDSLNRPRDSWILQTQVLGESFVVIVVGNAEPLQDSTISSVVYEIDSTGVLVLLGETEKLHIGNEFWWFPSHSVGSGKQVSFAWPITSHSREVCWGTLDLNHVDRPWHILRAVPVGSSGTLTCISTCAMSGRLVGLAYDDPRRVMIHVYDLMDRSRIKMRQGRIQPTVPLPSMTAAMVTKQVWAIEAALASMASEAHHDAPPPQKEKKKGGKKFLKGLLPWA